MNVDLFTAIHKAIRTLLFETGMKLQSSNMLDPTERIQIIQEIEKVLDMLHEHAVHEDDFIFPIIEQAVPGSTLLAESQHVEYAQKQDALIKLLKQLKEVRNVAECANIFQEVLHSYMEFLSFYLLHLNTEEQTCLPASRKVPQSELLEVRVRVQQDTAPKRYSEWLNYLFPSLSSNELLLLLRQVQLSAPKQIWHQMLQVGSTRVNKDRWEKMLELLNESEVL